MARRPCGRRTRQPFIWDETCVPPRATHPDDRPGNGLTSLAGSRVIPIRSCSRWGLPCRPCCQRRGGLLPHPFTLTPFRGGLLSVALSLGSPPPDVIRHRVSVEPGLSSPRGLSAICEARLPGRLAAPDSAPGRRRSSTMHWPTSQCETGPFRKEGPGPVAPDIRTICREAFRPNSGNLPCLRETIAEEPSPCCSSAPIWDSCSWRRVRHCISEWCRRSSRLRARAPWPDRAFRI